jgi:hypothetical protein
MLREEEATRQVGLEAERKVLDWQGVDILEQHLGGQLTIPPLGRQLPESHLGGRSIAFSHESDWYMMQESPAPGVEQDTRRKVQPQSCLVLSGVPELAAHLLYQIWGLRGRGYMPSPLLLRI